MSRSEPLTGGGEFAIGEPSMLGLPFGDHSSQTTCCQLPSRCSCDPRGNVLRVAVGSLANRFGKFGLERHGEAFNGHGPIILVLTIGVERLGRGRDAHTEGIQTQRFRRSSVSTRWPSSRSRPPLHATRRGSSTPSGRSDSTPSNWACQCGRGARRTPRRARRRDLRSPRRAVGTDAGRRAGHLGAAGLAKQKWPVVVTGAFVRGPASSAR